MLDECKGVCKIELKIRDYFINRRTCKGVSRAAPPLQRSNLRGQRQSRRTLQNEIVPESSLSARRTMLLSVPTERHAARVPQRGRTGTLLRALHARPTRPRGLRGPVEHVPGGACQRGSPPRRPRRKIHSVCSLNITPTVAVPGACLGTTRTPSHVSCCNPGAVHAGGSQTCAVKPYGFMIRCTMRRLIIK